MVNLEALKDIMTTDGEDDGGGEEGAGSINEIILRQIRKLGDIASAELTGGYWQKKPIQTSGGIMFTETYHEDLREAYINAVDFIVDLVYAISDEEFRNVVDEYEQKEEEDVKVNLKNHKKIFRELNMMFERTEFFDTSIDVTARST